MSPQIVRFLNPFYLTREINWFFKRKTLSRIKLLVLDVDGVLTDGGLWLDDKGNSQKKFNVKDGLGIRLLQNKGVKIAFLSGGSGEVINKRASQLGVEYCLIGVKNKSYELVKLQSQVKISSKHTAYLGDDLNDLVVHNKVSLLVATADACKPLIDKAHVVLKSRGGEGAVRELAERILKAKNSWRDIKDNGWIDKND